MKMKVILTSVRSSKQISTRLALPKGGVEPARVSRLVLRARDVVGQPSRAFPLTHQISTFSSGETVVSPIISWAHARNAYHVIPGNGPIERLTDNQRLTAPPNAL